MKHFHFELNHSIVDSSIPSGISDDIPFRDYGRKRNSISLHDYNGINRRCNMSECKHECGFKIVKLFVPFETNCCAFLMVCRECDKGKWTTGEIYNLNMEV